jgi:single-strand DNA-binding protein
MAINEKNANGDNVVTYITVKSMGKVAENCAKYLTTGSSVLVEGRLKLDQWKDTKTGQNRQMLYIHADMVTFLDSKPKTQTNQNNYENPPRPYDDDPVF